MKLKDLDICIAPDCNTHAIARTEAGPVCYVHSWYETYNPEFKRYKEAHPNDPAWSKVVKEGE
jgi:hypothetical protein